MIAVAGFTHVEQRGRQRRALRVLDGLLEREDLPPIAWTVGNVGANLVGHVLTGEEERRDTFTAWTRALGAKPSPERTHLAVTHLSAVARQYDGLVDIVLIVDLFPDLTDDIDLGRG